MTTWFLERTESISPETISPTTKENRTTSSNLWFWVVTGFGLGLSPVAPGTLGSLAGLALAYPVQRLSGAAFLAAYLFVGALLLLVGFVSCNWICRQLGKEDPSEAVIDEIAAQFLITALVPARPWQILASFLLFRFFDIAKIFPANRAERLPGGWGVMSDDLIAAVYSAATYWVVVWLMG